MALRWAINGVGMYLINRGYGNADILTALTGVAVSAFPFVWGWIRNSKVGILLATDGLPEVAGVIMKTTPEGVALAKATPTETVTPAGSVIAIGLARAA